MLTVNLDKMTGIATLEPDGKLSEQDFKDAANVIDPYIEQYGKLSGIIIHTKSFPGWDSFSALISHLKFIKDHHKKISYLAFVTDSPVGDLTEHVSSHFINAEIKSFTFAELDAAIIWILSEKSQ